jgi:hypothetical protein
MLLASLAVEKMAAKNSTSVSHEVMVSAKSLRAKSSTPNTRGATATTSLKTRQRLISAAALPLTRATPAETVAKTRMQTTNGALYTTSAQLRRPQTRLVTHVVRITGVKPSLRVMTAKKHGIA